MNQAEEDALYDSCHEDLDGLRVLSPVRIRLAIRAAVAQERERALQCAYSEFSVEGIAQRIAAAIQKGD